VIKDGASGEITELRCTYDPESRGGQSPDGRRVKGTLHWVSAAHAVRAEVRLFDHLMLASAPDGADESDFVQLLNPSSREVLERCMLEPGLLDARPGDLFQFLRNGYFCVDSVDSRPDALVFNRTVSLRDTWAKIKKSQGTGGS
jgi:glutaminyl-tRNA synthetase